MLASAVPLKTRVVSPVIWSPTVPVSVLIPVITGAAGAVASVTLMVVTAGLASTPARSVAENEKVREPACWTAVS